MKIYLDKALTQEVENVDLGTVEAGEKKEYTFYIYNELFVELIDLEFFVDSLEVKITSAPVQMNPRGVGELVLEYFPDVTIEQGLRAIINYKGKKVYK